MSNLREKMMHNVLFDNSMEQMLANEAELSVNSSQSTLDEGPVARSEVRNVGMVMMQVGDGNWIRLVLESTNPDGDKLKRLTKPVMNPEIGNKVEEEDVGISNLLSNRVEHSQHHDESNVRDQDELGLILAENSAGGLEMAHTQPAANTGWLSLHASLAAGGVEEEVSLPSEQLMCDEADDLSERGVFEQFMEVHSSNDGQPGLLGLCSRNESHVLFHVASESMVAMVRIFPREVRDQEEAVKGPANGVVE